MKEYMYRSTSALMLLFTIWASVVNGQTAPGRYRHRQPAPAPRPRVAYVSICESRSAYAYHNYVCRGLARCRSGVSEVTVAQARSLGYVPCKICY